MEKRRGTKIALRSAERDTPPVRVESNGATRWYLAHFLATVDSHELAGPITFEMVTETTGPRCVALTITARDPARGVGPQGTVPTPAALNRWVRFVVAEAASPVPLRAGSPMSMAAWPTSATASAREVERASRPNRRPRISPERLREVARLYREAVDEGLPPRPYLAERLGYPQPTVSRWTSEARKRVDPATGAPYLGPATGTRAGEQRRPATTNPKGRKP